MWTFRAMNTEVTIAAPLLDEADEHALALATVDLFWAVERKFSRFLPQSELSLLNGARSSLTVSAEMIALLQACRRHVEATHGLFDPTIGGALRAAGYDRTFFPGALDREHVADAPPPARFADLRIDEAARIVHRPAELQLDFGGFLKGRTVDRAAARAPSPAMIDAGGDAMLLGDGPEGAGWLVDVEDPVDPEGVLVTLRVRDRAVATSAPNRRRWRTGPAYAHHLIDPRTGLPSSSDLAQVTVIAPSAEQADVAAKAAFLLGSREAGYFVLERGLAAVLVDRAGRVELVGDVEVVDA